MQHKVSIDHWKYASAGVHSTNRITHPVSNNTRLEDHPAGGIAHPPHRLATPCCSLITRDTERCAPMKYTLEARGSPVCSWCCGFKLDYEVE